VLTLWGVVGVDPPFFWGGGGGGENGGACRVGGLFEKGKREKMGEKRGAPCKTGNFGEHGVTNSKKKRKRVVGGPAPLPNPNPKKINYRMATKITTKAH